MSAVAYEFEEVFNYENVKDKIQLRLYNKDIDHDVKISAKKYGFSDLVLIPYIIYDICDDEKNLRINDYLLYMWNKTVEDIETVGMENCKKETYLLHDVQEIYGKQDGQPPLYAITNKSFCFGAIGAIIMQDKLKEKFKHYTVIPSSVHECLITLAFEDDKIKNIINIINIVNDMLKPEEILGNTAYVF